VIDNIFFDHLRDRMRLASLALTILSLKPIKAAVGIIGSLLLGQEQRKTVALRERRPSCTYIVSCCGLGAAVQHDDQRRTFRKGRRSISKHSQVARVGSKVMDFLQMRGRMIGVGESEAAQALKDLVPSIRADSEVHDRFLEIDHYFPRSVAAGSINGAPHKYQTSSENFVSCQSAEAIRPTETESTREE
jgi:hypothetical protein